MSAPPPRASALALPALLVAGALALAPAAGAQAPTSGDPGAQPDATITDGTAARQLAEARARWRAAGIASYRTRIAIRCFCPGSITATRTVVVRRGRPIGAVPGHLRDVATVPRLFARIEEAIRAGAATLDVRYATSGRPTSVYVDRSRMIADEERGIVVRSFARTR